MKKRLMIIAAVISALAVAAVFKFTRQVPEDSALKLSGNVEITEVSAGFKTPGALAFLPKEEGGEVKKGELIAELESTEVENEVNVMRASLAEAGERLKELKAGARPQEITVAEAEDRFAAVELDKAKSDFTRAEALAKSGLLALSQLEAAKAAYETADARHKGALARLSLLKEGARKEVLNAAAHRARQAAFALNAAVERLKDTKLYSPLDGVVLKRISEPGETILPGRAVYTLGRLDSPWVKVYVKEDKLGLVKLGQKAEVAIDSYPGKIYEGAVTFISSQAEFTPKNVQTEEERVKLVFALKVSVKNPERELKPGMPADVRILLK